MGQTDQMASVDDYIGGLPVWQRALCEKLRALIHAADAGIEETIKRSVQPYFVLEGNVCALLATKDHVNLFIYDGGLTPDPDKIITSGHGNKTARCIAFYEGDKIPVRALRKMIKRIAAMNRAGGWRKLARERRSM